MTATAAEPLFGQTVVVIGGSAGIGLATARQARAAGAAVVLTGRNQERLDQAAKDVGALDIATFDATDFVALASFFDGLAHQVDHVMVSGSGPYYAPLAEIDLELARRDFDQHLFVPIEVARHALVKVRPSGSLVLIGGTGGRQPGIGRTTISAMTAAMPALTRNLAVEIAPIRVNLVAPGFVDTSLSASLLAAASTTGAHSCGRPCRSGGWSGRTTSPRWPSI